MTAEEFVELFAREREALVGLYSDPSSQTEVARLFRSSNSAAGTDQETFKAAIRQIVTDVYYSILLAIDGEASLGGVQQSYAVFAEDGSKVSGEPGDLEKYAFRVLQQS